MAREAEAKRIADEQAAAARKAIADEIAKREAAELAAKQEADRQAAVARKAIADQIRQREEAQRRADAIEAAARQAELERVRQEAARVRAEQEKAAALEAERKRAEGLARQQPDATQLRCLAMKIAGIALPVLASDAGRDAVGKIAAEIDRLSKRILATADKLEGKEQGGAK
jgi:colicin import membrane protein